MRGASLEQGAEVTIQEDTLYQTPEQTEWRAVSNEVCHDGYATLVAELMPVPEALKWSGDLLVLERPRRIELRDLRHQPHLCAEMRRFPGDDSTGSKQIRCDARHHALVCGPHRRDMGGHTTREIEAPSRWRADRGLDRERAQLTPTPLEQHDHEDRGQGHLFEA